MFNPYRNYRTLRRYQQIILTVGRFGFGEVVGRLNLFTLLKLKRKTAPTAESTAADRAVRFRMMLENLGPTFIKLGQMLATRPDLLPPDIVTELAQLHDRVSPTPWPKVSKALDHPLGADFAGAFAQFDEEPVASASIAQVYAAYLKTGQKVAVKIIRPGTRKTFTDDLAILTHLAGLIQTHIEEARAWNAPAIIEQFRTSIEHELDLRHEGRNADISRVKFTDDPNVYLPAIFWELSNRSVLVMEYIDGRPLSEFFENTDSATRKTLARRGADLVLKQVFEHGFFQADPHPGNVFVMPGNVICILDFGMFSRLDRRSLAVLSRVLHAVVNKDVDRLCKAARDLGVLPDQLDYPAFRMALLDLLEQYHGLPLKQISVPQLLRDIINLVNTHRIAIRPNFLFLIKAIGTAEATGRKLDPDFDMLELLRPFVSSLLLKRFSPEHILNNAQSFTEDLLLLTQESPEHLLEILRQIRTGRAKLEFHHQNLERPFSQLNQMSDKIVLGILLGSLVIASALMAHARIGPTLFGYPVIGGFGFLLAGVTGLWLIFDIIRSRIKR